MRHFMPLLAVATLILSTAAVQADLGDQLAKLLPNDGAANDQFGHSVAISGHIALVGAYVDDDNGSGSGSAYLFDTTTGRQIAKLLASDGAAGDVFGFSVAISGATAVVGAWLDGDEFGSAYLFDTTTGQQIAKLLPDDGAAGDWFGYSVAISGATAIVGAHHDDDNGSNSGSAYLFDTTTGFQIAKLLASDGAAGDVFGFSVAISGATAVVGAMRDDDNGSNSGSAYLFDTTTGRQVAKLLADDAATWDQFGLSVGISGATAIVGANFDDDNGIGSGSAYLFDTTTGQQIAKLLPNDGAADDVFGGKVAISGATAIVGANGNDDNGNNSGSAYLFDVTTGQQIAKLLPDDGATGDRFGTSVAISGTLAIVGARNGDDNGTDSGSAYLFAIDTDGDGLRDDWETGGIPYTDGNGDLQHFLLPSANPMHKDLYVEVDIMMTVPFSSDAMGTVMTAFANAPVDNPDGGTGINLQIDWQNAHMIGFDEMWGDDFLEFDLAKESFFGTPSERSDANWEHIKAAKKRAFRYCIFANRMEDLNDPDSNPMGIAELPGNDFYITLGGIEGLEERVIASTFMHEFGHNLILHHGGADDITYKPNYVSVMNYNFDCLVYENLMPLTIDFSREPLLLLKEFDLDETIGIQSIEYSNVLMYHGYQLPGEPTQIAWVQLNTPNYDWNHDGSQEQGVHADLNWLDPADDDSPDEVMNSYNDWDLIVLPLGTDGDYADLVHDTVDYPEIDEQTFHWLRENVPPPPGACLADLNGDGAIGPFDLAFVLGHWGPNPGHPADLDGDGVVGPFDLALVLGNWGLCP